MTLDDLVKRADALIELARISLRGARKTDYGTVVRSEDFANLRSSALSFIEQVYGREHSHYQEFHSSVRDVGPHYTERALGILVAIRGELAGGWLRSTRGLISAELFADFLEMAEHLLSQGYKDPAAVVIGSVLEEHLRQLAAKHDVAIHDLKDGRAVPRKAEALNADLRKADAYSLLDQKSITGWLDLRNSAAHGKYAAYSTEQVEVFFAGVQNFLMRHPL